MSAPAYAGEVRLGVPHDIVGPYMPPILRRFDKAWPRVRVALKCTNTPLLRELMSQGALDLTLTTEQRCGHGGEVLLEDDLVWAGAPNGAAHRRDPLPVSLGDENCEFRASVLEALAATGRDWRPVCEVSGMEPLLASLEADLAVGPFLRRSIPDYLTVVEDRACRGCRSSSSTCTCRRRGRTRSRWSWRGTSPRSSPPTSAASPAPSSPPAIVASRCRRRWPAELRYLIESGRTLAAVGIAARATARAAISVACKPSSRRGAGGGGGRTRPRWRPTTASSR